jgi:predicted dehydrogenase
VTREIGIGLLGVGWMGRLHTASYRRVRDHYPELELVPRFVIAADEVAERAEEARRTLGYEAATEDWQEVLAHPEVEAVSITSPNVLHLPMAVAAARAGKHMRVEKPLGRSLAETQAIADEVAAAGVRTMVGLNYRHTPAVQHARDLVEQGAIGDLTRFRGWFLGDYGADPRIALSWRFSRKLAGLGAVGDVMPHAVDLALLLAGPVEAATAVTQTFISKRPRMPAGTGTHFSLVEGGEQAEVDNEDYALALVRFARGFTGSVEASRVTVGKHAEAGFEIHGTKGAIAWDFKRMNELEVYLPLADGDAGSATIYMGPQHPEYARFQPGPAIAMGYDDLKVIEARLFLESISDGVQRKPGVAEMLSVARVLDAVARSGETGTWTEIA